MNKIDEIANPVETEISLSQKTITNSPSRDDDDESSSLSRYLTQPERTFTYVRTPTTGSDTGPENAEDVYDNDDYATGAMELTNSPVCKIITSNAPNFDSTVALQLYNQALITYLEAVGELTHEPEMAFTEETFIFLDPFIRHMSSFSCKAFFTHVNSLYVTLEEGVQAAMQRWLIQSLVNKALFWPKAATHLGLRAPIQNIDELGKLPSFRVRDNDARDDVNLKLLGIRKDYETRCELVLIDQARACSKNHYRSFMHQFKQRFNDANDMGKWINDTKLEWTAALDSNGVQPECQPARIAEQVKSLKDPSTT